jgi:hypothetical protein
VAEDGRAEHEGRDRGEHQLRAAIRETGDALEHGIANRTKFSKYELG